MKTKTHFKKESRQAWYSYSQTIKNIFFSALILTGIQAPLQAQKVEYTKPSFWIGAAGGANFNFYRGSTQKLNEDLTVPTAFHNGFGVGIYIAPLLEFHRPDSRWGVMLQAGYDNRKGEFKEIITPCNCPTDLSANMSYITVEPSLRFAPFKSNFYLYGGPRLAFIMDKSFTYQQKTNPDYPEQTANPEVKGDFSDVNKTVVSMQIGVGYDIALSPSNEKIQVVLSPFVSFQPYFGQSPRSIETWNVTTLRGGIALKFGYGHRAPAEAAVTEFNPEIPFSIKSPKNIPAERKVKETFPLRNYVFFDKGSNELPNRYVTLSKDQVKIFKEEQAGVFTSKNPLGRSSRQMTVYYNILNILGDRMQKNPATTINLVGSSEQGPADAKAMAESIKKYLVDIFEINASRISTEGRDKPKLPSEVPGGTKELELLSEGNRRVSIESGSPALLMEFQSGPNAPLKPVEINIVQEAPLDSYITFSVAGQKEAFTSWSLVITDEKGAIQNFGPYTREKVSIPGKSILGSRPEGTYKVTMIGQTGSDKTVKKETSAHMVLWTPAKSEEGMRFSVIFEYDESKLSATYEKYITDILVPKIPKGGTIIIHGYTDIIGDDAYNLKMSMARAVGVKKIIENSLSKLNRSDVQYEVYGFGEDQNVSLFENKFPEERFYNRTVVIDIIPSK